MEKQILNDLGDTSVTTVQNLDLNVPENLARTARTLVHNKYLIDQMVDTNGDVMIASDLHDGGYGPHLAMPFLYRVVPFLQAGKCSDNPFYALVPTAHTLGCSWSWRGSHLKADEVARRRKELTDTDALLAGSLNKTLYTWIKPLGIIAPSEGKNRVDFLRDEGIASIPAKVVERSYPDAAQITIYNVECSAFKETWAVLEGRWVQKVCNPSWTLPLMEAYGVNINQQWPEHFPRLQKVVLAMFERPGNTSPLGHPDFDTDAIVDLDTINAKAQYQSEEVTCTALDLKHVQIDYRLWIAIAVCFVIGAVGLSATPAHWVQVQVCAGIIIGLSFGALCVPLMGLLTTKRRHVKYQPFLPPELAPKNQDRTSRHMPG